MTAVNHSAVQQEAPATLNAVINHIAVSRVQTLRQQRRGRIETTDKVMLAEWDPLHALLPPNVFFISVDECFHIQSQEDVNQSEPN